MSGKTPHYLLFSDHESPANALPGGKWHFLLESLQGDECIEAEDTEPDVSGERLELLAVVRGLEALDQPSRVTLVTPSRYVSRGIRIGLEEWRAADWKWERHGWMVPVTNADLWQRVDRAMQYHEIHCRRWRTDQAHGLPGPHAALAATEASRRHSAAFPAESAGKRKIRAAGAARSVLRAMREGVAAAMQAGDQAYDFGMQNWSLAR